MRRPEELQEVALELVGEVVDVLLRILADNHHLSDVRLALDVAFEPVLIATLLLAHLAIPPEALQTFRLELVAHILRGAYFGSRHGAATVVLWMNSKEKVDV